MSCGRGDASGLSDTPARITAVSRHAPGARALLRADTSDAPDTTVQIPPRIGPAHDSIARAARDTSGKADAIR